MFFVYISGVLFEMMSTEMRKKSPETMDDLKKMNFTVVDHLHEYHTDFDNGTIVFPGPYEFLEEERRLVY
jgi:hypothetical protein